MTEEVSNATPASESIQEQEATPVETRSETGTEHTPAPTEAPEQTTEPQKKTPWYQTRINELTREKKEAREEAARLAAEREELRRAIEANRQGDATQQIYQPHDIQSQIHAEAQALVAKQRFDEACNSTFNKGKEEFKDFDGALSRLGMLGDVPREFLEAVTSIEDGHKVLHHLGSNLDEAADVLRLPPVQLGIRLASIQGQLGKKQPPPISQAPAPIKPIDSGGKSDSDPSSIEDWMAKRSREKPIRR